MEIALVKEQDSNLQPVMDMHQARPDCPAWECVSADSGEVTILWSQYSQLKVQAGVLQQMS